MDGYVRKFLHISTAHLQPSTQVLIESRVWIQATCFHCERGFFIYVPFAADVHRTVPADLAECLDTAREFGCDYVLFDRDGRPHPDLPVYKAEDGS